jgi:hypothetical protein
MVWHPSEALKKLIVGKISCHFPNRNKRSGFICFFVCCVEIQSGRGLQGTAALQNAGALKEAFQKVVRGGSDLSAAA